VNRLDQEAEYVEEMKSGFAKHYAERGVTKKGKQHSLAHL
jgi:hypothetical protein